MEAKNIKKLDIISLVAIVLTMVGLWLLNLTGMIGHIVIACIGVAVLAVCTVLQHKTWKFKILEILYRVFYLLTIISGLVMILANIHGAISIAHIVTACIFSALYLVNFLLKLKK